MNDDVMICSRCTAPQTDTVCNECGGIEFEPDAYKQECLLTTFRHSLVD